MLLQILTILILAFTIVCGIIAFSTDTILFYRLMNAAPFKQFPGTVTVALDFETKAHIGIVFILYLICLGTEVSAIFFFFLTLK